MTLHILRADEVRTLTFHQAAKANIPMVIRCHCGGKAGLMKCVRIDGEWYAPSWHCKYECPNGRQEARGKKHKIEKTYYNE